MTRRAAVPLVLIAGLTAVRVFLAAAARPGRDELVYWYWSWHVLDAGYSLVSLGAIRLATSLLGDGALAIRLPGLLAATGSILLLGRIARRGGATTERAGWIAAALAASPWLGYTGTVAHPDAFLLLGALLLADGATSSTERGTMRLAAGALVAAFSKLTGALLLPVAFVALLRGRGPGRRRTVALAMLLAGGLVLAASQRPDTWEGVRRLGTFAPGTSAAVGLLVATGEAILLAGPALILLGAAGLRRGGVARVAAIGWLAFHAAFAGLGQAKGNWFLPALALAAAAAASTPALRRPAPAVVTSTLLSLLLLGLATGAGRLPEAMDRTYAGHVGEREAAVSPTRLWSERFAEYAWTPPDLRWPEGVSPGSIRLVGRDYGLLCGLARSLGRSAEVHLPDDPLFRPGDAPPRPGEDLLWVADSPPDPEWSGHFREVVPVPNPEGLHVYHLRGATAGASRSPAEGETP